MTSDESMTNVLPDLPAGAEAEGQGVGRRVELRNRGVAADLHSAVSHEGAGGARAGGAGAGAASATVSHKGVGGATGGAGAGAVSATVSHKGWEER